MCKSKIILSLSVENCRTESVYLLSNTYICLHNPQFTLCNRQKTHRLSDHHRDDLCTKPVHTHVHRYGQISHQITTLSCLWEEAGAPRGNPRRIRGTDTRETPTPCTTVSPHDFFFFFFKYCLLHLFWSSLWIVYILFLLKILTDNESLSSTFLSQEFEILLFNWTCGTWPFVEWSYTYTPKCCKNLLLRHMNKGVTTVGGLVATHKAEANHLWATPLGLSVLLLEGELYVTRPLPEAHSCPFERVSV